jgi:hypothetical protein
MACPIAADFIRVAAANMTAVAMLRGYEWFPFLNTIVNKNPVSSPIGINNTRSNKGMNIKAIPVVDDVAEEWYIIKSKRNGRTAPHKGIKKFVFPAASTRHTRYGSHE